MVLIFNIILHEFYNATVIDNSVYCLIKFKLILIKIVLQLFIYNIL